MPIYYLYKKTHKITGLKYLGITRQDPFKYKGSGTVWTAHIKLHGYQVDTEILLETCDKVELADKGKHLSDLWKVVSDPSWANCIPETCGGPGGKPGVKKSAEMCAKMKIHNAGKNNPSFGNYWWTNGFDEIKSKICPGEEWRRGRSHNVKQSVAKSCKSINRSGHHNPQYGKRWWTNGVDTIKSFSCPGPEWNKGVSQSFKNKCYNKIYKQK